MHGFAAQQMVSDMHATATWTQEISLILFIHFFYDGKSSIIQINERNNRKCPR